MTEIGNRIYPQGRDQRLCVRVCVCRCLCVGEEEWEGGIHVDLLHVDREVWQLGLLMRGRALLDQAEHRPLGFEVLAVFTCPAVSQAADYSLAQMGCRRSRNSTSNFSQPFELHSVFSFSADLAKLPLMVRTRPGSLNAPSCGIFFSLFFFRLPAAACIYVIIDYSYIVWSWLTASDIYAYARVCIWIPLFLTRHTHTHTHINTPRCTGVIMLHTYPAAQTHTHSQTHTPCQLLLFLTFCRYHCVQKLGLFDAALDWRWPALFDAHTDTLFWDLCNHLSVSPSLCFHPSCSSSSFRLHRCPSAITGSAATRTDRFHTQPEKHVNKALSGWNANMLL